MGIYRKKKEQIINIDVSLQFGIFDKSQVKNI